MNNQIDKLLQELARNDGQLAKNKLSTFPENVLQLAEAEGLVELDADYLLLSVRGKEQVQQQSSDEENTEDVGDAPFNPDDIRIQSQSFSIFDIVDQMREDYIKVNPDFQRNFVWDRKRQSALIESLLLRIPLPSLYFSADENGILHTVDGLQRLSTLKAFCFTPEEAKEHNVQPLKLTGLNYFKELNGKTFKELPVGLKQTLLRRNHLHCYTIESATPRKVQFEIFSRLNRGGLTLRAQELRHALYQGPATKLLKGLASKQLFQEVTVGTLSPLRMDDQECILRFIAFYYFPYTGERDQEGLDSLLNRTMEELNTRSAIELEVLGDIFEESLHKVNILFGRYSFRRFSDESYSYKDRELVWGNSKLNPINKTFFETWMNLVRPYSIEQLQAKRTALIERFAELQSRNDFLDSVAYNTGSNKAIVTRFSMLEQLFAEVFR
jgi:hypothetical protein